MSIDPVAGIDLSCGNRKFGRSMAKTPAKAETSQKILDVAQELVQTRGYNAFSYADIAASLHVTTASLHYHFPSKAVLGHSLIQRYSEGFRKALARIDEAGAAAPQKIRGYVAAYAQVLANHRMCLCGMLAAEYETLPKPMQSALDHFFELNEVWLERVLENGRRDGSLAFAGPAREFLACDEAREIIDLPEKMACEKARLQFEQAPV